MSSAEKSKAMISNTPAGEGFVDSENPLLVTTVWGCASAREVLVDSILTFSIMFVDYWKFENGIVATWKRAKCRSFPRTFWMSR